MIFALLLLGWGVATAALWWRADRLARAVPSRPARWILRAAFAAFYAAVLAYLGVPLLHRVIGHEPWYQPPAWATAAYLWFPIVVNVVLVSVAAAVGAGWVVRRRSPRSRAAASPASSLPAALPWLTAGRFSRRQALGLAAAAVPPVTTVGLTAAALTQRAEVRVRRLELVIPSLPPDLDGLTILHLTDLHVGNFFPPDACRRLADVVNALPADLVAFTGDLIDRGLLDRLPLGIDFIRRLDPRNGLVMIEGNHDQQEDAVRFEAAVAQAGLPFLLEGETTLAVPGRRTPVQFLGIPWGGLAPDLDAVSGDGTARMHRTYTDAWAAGAVGRVAALRRPGAFPILLAHHPHALDPAAAAGLPLVLAGHTHGGQVMLTERIGAGPLRFRYWNGVHRRAGTTMSISNGIGSWFPLRVNAPAEVVHVTLRAGGPLADAAGALPAAAPSAASAP